MFSNGTHLWLTPLHEKLPNFMHFLTIKMTCYEKIFDKFSKFSFRLSDKLWLLVNQHKEDEIKMLKYCWYVHSELCGDEMKRLI